MFPDYQLLVKQYYENKRSENDLPLGLLHPTPAKLRTECLMAFNKEILKKDRKILTDFFEESGDDGAILKKIKNYDADGFKPLLNYLRGLTASTDPKNIELLAWLIGFEDRPYDYRKNYALDDLQTKVTTPEAITDVAENKEEKEEQAEQIEENKLTEVEINKVPPQVLITIVDDKNIEQINDVEEKEPLTALPLIAFKLRTNKKAVTAILILAISAAIVIFIYKENGRKESRNFMGSTLSKEVGGCMYWAGDHYQQVPCNQKMGDTSVIALDMERLNSLKKITREDTITRNSKGWVWYIKLNNKVEFFTSYGNYPSDPTLKLKPITDYIISKYVDTNRQGASN